MYQIQKNSTTYGPITVPHHLFYHGQMITDVHNKNDDFYGLWAKVIEILDDWSG